MYPGRERRNHPNAGAILQRKWLQKNGSAKGTRSETRENSHPGESRKRTRSEKGTAEKEVSKGSVSATPPTKTAGKAPEKPKGAPRRGKEQIVYIKLDDLHAFKNHPFEVRDDEAITQMVEENLNQREILPSERAKALKMQLEAIKHQGSRISGQIGMLPIRQPKK